jgi:hypothetical protein
MCSYALAIRDVFEEERQRYEDTINTFIVSEERQRYEDTINTFIVSSYCYIYVLILLYMCPHIIYIQY